MKILLVNPPRCGRSIPEERYGVGAFKLILRGEPMALEALAGNLWDHEVRILDLKVTPDGLDAALSDMDPDVVGITAVTCEANAARRIAGQIRARTKAAVAVGGQHATCDPDFFNVPEIDYVALGLGKASFRELITALERKEETDAIPGVARTRPGREMTFTPRQYGFADLVDDRPPRYDLVAENRDHYVMSGVGGRTGFVVSALGCTHKCLFCAIPPMTGGRYLTHSVESVLRDIDLLPEVPTIRLVDANTYGDTEYARRLGRALIDAGFSRKIVADVRADTVVRDPELFRLWKDAGLAVAVIGFEAVSDAHLRALGKRSEVATHVAAIRILKDLGIRIVGDFIVSPDFDRADFDAMEAFVAENPVDLPLPAILTPMPGTPLHHRMKDRITIHDLDYYTFINAVFPTRLPEREFYGAYTAMLNRFLSHIHQDAT